MAKNKVGPSQVDVNKDKVESKSRQMQPVLAFNGPAMFEVVGWRGDSIVNGEDDGESPGK